MLNDNSCKNHGSEIQTVHNAIDRSISHDESVTIPWSEIAERELLTECDDWHVRTVCGVVRTVNYWGTDLDGNEWSVTLRMRG